MANGADPHCGNQPILATGAEGTSARERRQAERFDEMHSLLMGGRWTPEQADSLILLINQGAACFPPRSCDSNLGRREGYPISSAAIRATLADLMRHAWPERTPENIAFNVDDWMRSVVPQHAARHPIGGGLTS